MVEPWLRGPAGRRLFSHCAYPTVFLAYLNLLPATTQSAPGAWRWALPPSRASRTGKGAAISTQGEDEAGPPIRRPACIARSFIPTTSPPSCHLFFARIPAPNSRSHAQNTRMCCTVAQKPLTTSPTRAGRREPRYYSFRIGPLVSHALARRYVNARRIALRSINEARHDEMKTVFIKRKNTSPLSSPIDDSHIIISQDRCFWRPGDVRARTSSVSQRPRTMPKRSDSARAMLLHLCSCHLSDTAYRHVSTHTRNQATDSHPRPHHHPRTKRVFFLPSPAHTDAFRGPERLPRPSPAPGVPSTIFPGPTASPAGLQLPRLPRVKFWSRPPASLRAFVSCDTYGR
ncbi:hypothetical protein CALCODRAFT_289083 [Calocera cornea HHB12733]|uniref:Uncharacterized protein n=1 Tax=Calocera cornea HHB12733 TaxID=1353952 RepID=A0A165FW19_9BASI|nr:hypothetical protein CALCODRAFT_289083 [Calocera cornea HHB12733]